MCKSMPSLCHPESGVCMHAPQQPVLHKAIRVILLECNVFHSLAQATQRLPALTLRQIQSLYHNHIGSSPHPTPATSLLSSSPSEPRSPHSGPPGGTSGAQVMPPTPAYACPLGSSMSHSLTSFSAQSSLPPQGPIYTIVLFHLQL